MALRIQLQGGLGNQLFIWAMAHHLIANSNKKIQIVYWTDGDSRDDRPLELDRLKDFCNHDISIKKMRFLGLFLKVIDKISSIRFLQNFNFYRFFRVYPDQNSYDLPNDDIKSGLLRGFFQNVKVAESNKDTLRRELLECLSQVESIPNPFGRTRDWVLHIRRGDTTDMSAEWGILNLAHYSSILADSQRMSICTDDVYFEKAINSHFPLAEVLTPENGDAWQTLKVMYEAKKLVMANSTLSWWSGWLASQDPGKEIYFPTPWRPESTVGTTSLIFDRAIPTKANFGME
jgi:hypothetical protein